jgi:hypothetical protein
MVRSPSSRTPPKPSQPERRSPLFILTGLVLGLLAGLAIAWLIYPARVGVIGPVDLPNELREQYRVVTALAYASSGDVGRARARLDLLGPVDVVRQLTSQAQLALLDQDSQREARALAQLADALAGEEPEGEGAQEADPPVLVDGAAFSISEQQLICADEGPPMLKLFFLDSEGVQRAGVELRLSGGETTLEGFTGLRPELGAGYAEFELAPQVDYSLWVQGGDVLTGVRAVACEGTGNWGTWLLTLRSN